MSRYNIGDYVLVKKSKQTGVIAEILFIEKNGQEHYYQYPGAKAFYRLNESEEWFPAMELKRNR